MDPIRISSTGLYDPPYSVSNEELVEAFNIYVARHNEAHAAEIEAGTVKALEPSSVDFIVKASGIKNRKVMDKSGIIDPEFLAPRHPERPNEALSVMAEMSVNAATQALKKADRKAEDIDVLLVSCSNMQRAYPAISIEVQNALGIGGYAFDMNVACASATFGLQVASDMIRTGNARSVLMVNPEITTGHLNFRDRDSHFIFGDVCTAVLLETPDRTQGQNTWEILGTKLTTKFSNNIRNNFGFLNRCGNGTEGRDKLFVQEGRKVFKDVVPLVADLILDHLKENDLSPEDVRRFWLNQANLNMNQLIAKKVLGHDPSEEEAPITLNEYGNTSSAGSVVAFHKYSDDLAIGDIGILCAFGAGYSAGSVVLRKAS
ncbi:MAG: beta-ketoacyl-ACP synthase III [Pseudomonadota bacterium]